MNRYSIDKGGFWSRIKSMLLKRKVLCALNEYEDTHAKGWSVFHQVKRHDFIAFFLKGNPDYSDSVIDRCISDCIEDGYIREDLVAGDPYRTPKIDMSGYHAEAKEVVPQIEMIHLSSAGRDFKKWSFFLLKYVPETFSKPTEIIITVVISLITTLITLYFAVPPPPEPGVEETNTTPPAPIIIELIDYREPMVATTTSTTTP
jgi:hypothetical protein